MREMLKEKKWMAMDVELIAVRGPAAEKTNTVIGDPSGSKSGGATCTHGVTGDAVVEELA